MDGFDPDYAKRKCKGGVVLCGLLASHGDPLKAFEFAERLAEKAGFFFAFDRNGITGQMPHFRAAARVAAASYPLSATAARGAISRPMSSSVSKERLPRHPPDIDGRLALIEKHAGMVKA